MGFEGRNLRAGRVFPAGLTKALRRFLHALNGVPQVLQLLPEALDGRAQRPLAAGRTRGSLGGAGGKKNDPKSSRIQPKIDRNASNLTEIIPDALT